MMALLSEPQKAYIACAIDGEGSITFKTRRFTRTNWLYDVRVTITNTNRNWLEGLVQEIGAGGIHSNGKQREGKKGWKFAIDGQKAQALLLEIKPYLRMKLAQCELALAHMAAPSDMYNRWHGMNIEFKDARIKAMEAMRKLNQRGCVTDETNHLQPKSNHIEELHGNQSK